MTNDYPETLYRAHASMSGIQVISFGDKGANMLRDLEDGMVFYEEFKVVSTTPAGCYVKLYADEMKWVSLTHRKRFAYPTKEEALVNLIKRRESWLKILERQLVQCTEELKVAKRYQACEAARSLLPPRA